MGYQRVGHDLVTQQHNSEWTGLSGEKGGGGQAGVCDWHAHTPCSRQRDEVGEETRKSVSQW